jgi:hypothetical protein
VTSASRHRLSRAAIRIPEDGSSASRVYLSPVAGMMPCTVLLHTFTTPMYSSSRILRSTRSLLSSTLSTGHSPLNRFPSISCKNPSDSLMHPRSMVLTFPVSSRQVAEMVHRDREPHGRHQGAERASRATLSLLCTE